MNIGNWNSRNQEIEFGKRDFEELFDDRILNK